MKALHSWLHNSSFQPFFKLTMRKIPSSFWFEKIPIFSIFLRHLNCLHSQVTFTDRKKGSLNHFSSDYGTIVNRAYNSTNEGLLEIMYFERLCVKQWPKIKVFHLKWNIYCSHLTSISYKFILKWENKWLIFNVKIMKWNCAEN